MKDGRLSDPWALSALKECHKEQVPSKDKRHSETSLRARQQGRKAGQEGPLTYQLQHKA